MLAGLKASSGASPVDDLKTTLKNAVKFMPQRVGQIKERRQEGPGTTQTRFCLLSLRLMLRLS